MKNLLIIGDISFKGLQAPGAALKVDGYMLSYFISAMKGSPPLRTAFINHWSKQSLSYRKTDIGQSVLVMVALMTSPKSEVLDLLG